MSPKHSAVHTRWKKARRFLLFITLAIAVAVAIGLLARTHPERQMDAPGDSSRLEIRDDDVSATDEQGTQDAEDATDVTSWIKLLNDEQKAELDIAYEASVADGYQGSMDEWVATEVQARLNENGNVVVTLPDGGEFVVVRDAAAENGPRNDSSEKDADTDDSTDALASDDGAHSADSAPQDRHSALITVDTVVAHKGDKRISLPIKILGNPGVLGMTFSVSYDESAMTLVGAENGTAFEGVLAFTRSRTFASGCLFTWDGVDIKPDQVKDGIALTLVFDVADDASGLHSVAVRGASAFDADLDSISLTTQDGSIVIE